MEFRIIFSLQYSINVNTFDINFNTFEVDPPLDSLHNAVVKPKNIQNDRRLGGRNASHKRIG
jgi:hypothetical protein